MSLEKQVSAGTREGGRPLLTLVIPTRNEEGNLPRLVRELEDTLSGVEYQVVFVDDSTDGTPEVIRSISQRNERVFLIRRAEAEREGGLSTAVAAGMDAVAGGSEYTCAMDADLQHPPAKVREMLEKARESSADVVVASRYARGGSYEGLPGPLRKAVSIGSKSLAQVVFKEARKTSDPMTGFFLLRNAAIAGIQFRPTGFKILLEILVCAPELKVVEVPLSFQARYAGVSKANVAQGLEYLTHIGSLFWYVPSAGRFWKFALVGASGTLVNLLTLIALVEYFDAGPTVAWIVAVGVEHPEQLPPEQRLHLARRQALQQDPLPPARRPGLSGSYRGPGSELRGLLSPDSIPRRGLPLLCDRRLPRHSRRDERELHPELPLRLPPLHPERLRPQSPTTEGSRSGSRGA